jgi:hypothetical protein
MSGCVPWWNVEDTYDPRFIEIPSPFFHLPEVATLESIGSWVAFNIKRVNDIIHDRPEYWQSPDQTYVWRAGDCEDHAILMMYLLHVELGGWPELARGTYGITVKNGHAWVIYNGRWYEPQTDEDVTGYPEYVLGDTISYGVAMWRSMNTHKSEGVRR